MARDVPEALWLTESLLNSIDVEAGQDDLDSLPRFARWLRDHGRAAAADTVTEADLVLARRLRDELRTELLGHHDGGTRDRSTLDSLAGSVMLSVRVGPDGSMRFAPAESGTRGVFGEVLAAVALASCDGTWDRLKICGNDECAVVFYDRSKNACRRWCSMEVCGNRVKTRAYRQRRAADQ
ncbi:MAG TPA: CGNR zinc finger domain-containing protein [Micromonosporaceae bacterium]|nr:CGNR zinc finger domain-containing protein [Micromonosporaceae bacterium]